MEINEAEKLKKKADNFEKEVINFEKELTKAMKSLFIEETEIQKFIIEQRLKNIDVIIDILKLTTSLSVSMFIASLTTTYFNEKIYIIIIINIISITLLGIFINARNSISLKGEKTLLEILNKSKITTHDVMLLKKDNIKLKCNDINKKLKKLKNKN